FYQYIQVNSTFIPNYADRYNHGKTISSSIAESAVNELISKRMAKKQQMRWIKKRVHLLLQVRIKTLDQALRHSFEKWYPNMRREHANLLPLVA
ncbi:MAG: ISKra4 family transposase, partial [Alphaproteobacteria bacterium]